MKFLPAALSLACAVLAISLMVMKHGDTAQHENDAGAIADFSNRLDSAQTKLAIREGTILTLSNGLDECRSASGAFSNRLAEAEFTLALDAEEITNLTRRVAEMESENQTLQTAFSRRVTDLTNQVAGLARQIALTQTNLNQANASYALLENRLRRDVAERIVVERKFNNRSELQAQMEKLKKNPAGEISAADIYAGLDVEVKSNAFHVIAPN